MLTADPHLRRWVAMAAPGGGTSDEWSGIASLPAAISGLHRFAGSLGASAGNGPWFYPDITNIAPTHLVPLLPNLLGK